MRSLKFPALGLVLALTAAPLGAGEAVSHPQLGLRLSVPDGFASDPDRVNGDVVYAFQRPPAGDQQAGTFVVVSRLGGVLGREKLSPRDVAAKSPDVTLTTETWRGFELQVFRVPEQAGDVRLLTFNAPVPLKSEAVQVAVIGEADREAELREILRSVLDGLDGQTNWLNTEQRAARFVAGVTKLAITVAVLAVIAVVVWRALPGKRKGRGRAAGGVARARRHRRPEPDGEERPRDRGPLPQTGGAAEPTTPPDPGA